MTFRLLWVVHEEIPNLSIRIKLVNDYGVHVANYFLKSFMNAERGECQKTFDMDLSSLMYGKYNATIVFSGSVVEGTGQLVEAINNAFSFEIVKREQDIYWSSQYWGNIKLDALKIVDVEDV